MNAPNPQMQQSVLDKFGITLGMVLGFLGTMPLYHQTYYLFHRLVLRYAHYSDYWAWDIAWKVCLFFFILTATWFALVMCINVIKGLIITFIVLFRKGVK